jgi:hypothetical protein
MGDWDDEDNWEADVNLDALDSKLGAKSAKSAWDDEEDEVVIAAPEVAKPSQSTIAAKLKAMSAEEYKLNNSVKYAMQEEEGVEDKKSRERKEVEDADHALTEELMGGGPKPVKKLSSLGSASSGTGGLAAIPLNTKQEHITFGVTISKKLEKSTPLTVVAFMKSLCSNLPECMTTDSLDKILAVLNAERAAKRDKEGEVAKVKTGKSSKQIKNDQKRHNDVFGGIDKHDEYYEQYGHMEDDFM